MMSTTPIIFNTEIARTIIGGSEKNPYASKPISVLLLSRSGSHFKPQILDALMKSGFQSIVSVEKFSKNYALDELSRRFPCVRFIIPQEEINIGQMINIGMKETEGETVFVVWDDIKIRENILSDFVLSKLSLFEKPLDDFTTSDNTECKIDIPRKPLCLLPSLYSASSHILPVKASPSIDDAYFTVTLSKLLYEHSISLYPYDFMGIYNKKHFFEMGGFDSELSSPYWQNVEFGLRSWLWGYALFMSPAFRLSYEGERATEDMSIDDSYYRFYLKNIIPRCDKGKISYPKKAFLPYAIHSGHFFKAIPAFREAKKWVDSHSDKYKLDFNAILAFWKTY